MTLKVSFEPFTHPVMAATIGQQQSATALATAKKGPEGPFSLQPHVVVKHTGQDQRSVFVTDEPTSEVFDF